MIAMKDTTESDTPEQAAWQQLLGIAKQIAKKHADPKKARKAFAARVRKDQELMQLCAERLYETAFARLVHDQRHQAATFIKFNPNRCDRGLEVMTSAADAVNETLFDWFIGDKRLGDCLGAELPALAQDSREKARGYSMNARLFDWLAGRVDEQKTVRECVKLREVESEWKAIQGGGHDAGESRAVHVPAKAKSGRGSQFKNDSQSRIDSAPVAAVA